MPNELMKTLTIGANTYDLPQKTSDLTNDSSFISSTTADDTYLPKSVTSSGGLENSITYAQPTREESSVTITSKYGGKTQLELYTNGTNNQNGTRIKVGSTTSPTTTFHVYYTSSGTYTTISSTNTTISSTNTTINGVVTPTADGMAANKKYVDDSISAITASSIGAVAKAGDTITGNVVLNYGTGATTGSPSITFSTDYGSMLKLAALEEYSYIQSDTLQLRADVQMQSGKTLTLASDPTANLQAATKQYVDNAITAAIGAAIGGSY